MNSANSVGMRALRSHLDALQSKVARQAKKRRDWLGDIGRQPKEEITLTFQEVVDLLEALRDVLKEQNAWLEEFRQVLAVKKTRIDVVLALEGVTTADGRHIQHGALSLPENGQPISIRDITMTPAGPGDKMPEGYGREVGQVFRLRREGDKVIGAVEIELQYVGANLAIELVGVKTSEQVAEGGDFLVFKQATIQAVALIAGASSWDLAVKEHRK